MTIIFCIFVTILACAATCVVTVALSHASRVDDAQRFPADDFPRVLNHQQQIR